MALHIGAQITGKCGMASSVAGETGDVSALSWIFAAVGLIEDATELLLMAVVVAAMSSHHGLHLWTSPWTHTNGKNQSCHLGPMSIRPVLAHSISFCDRKVESDSL